MGAESEIHDVSLRLSGIRDVLEKILDAIRAFQKENLPSGSHQPEE